MEIGSASADKISSEFRNISTKRKHGILTIETEDPTYAIVFTHGRIAQVTRSDELLPREVCKRLVQAQHLDPAILESVLVESETIEPLYKALVQQKQISSAVFMQAFTAYEMDLLHAIRRYHRLITRFSSQVVTIDPALSLSLSPGQLLLDLVEIEGDEQRFREIFGDEKGAPVMVSRCAKAPRSTTPVVQELWAQLATDEVLEELTSHVLRSEHEIRQALLALYDQKAIEISTTEATNGRSRGAALIGTTDFLSKLDEEFGGDEMDLLGEDPSAEVSYSDDPTFEPPLEEQLLGAKAKQVEPRVAPKAVVAKPVVVKTSPPEPEYIEEVPNEAEWSESNDEFTAAPLVDVAEVERESLSEEFEDSADMAPLPDLDFQSESLSERAFRWNCFLREEEGLRVAGTVVTFVVLLFVAISIPAQIQAFFDALTWFTVDEARLITNLGVGGTSGMR